MSFILDALKKSEAERQPQSAAEFASLPSPAAKSATPTWIWLAGLLLLINLAVLIGLLWRSESEPAVAATHVTRSANEDFANQVEIARRNPPPQQVDNRPVASESIDNPAPTRVAPTLISQTPESVDMDNQHPTIHELRAGGAVSIPDLHLDIHVYSDVPAERFVFINMSKHREGSQLDEGPKINEITPLGVVLTHAGNTFLLPRE